MISLRYARFVAFFLALALIPTVIHNYIGLMIYDGKFTKKIDQTLGEFTSRQIDRKAKWVTGSFGDIDWIERIYQDSVGSKIRLFVGRSYDHKRLYHHPELVLSYGQELKESGIEYLSSDSKIPVRLLRKRVGTGLVAYVLVCDGLFIEEPIKYQILNSFNLLFRGKKPMTLFYIENLTMAQRDLFTGSPAAALLQKAIANFEAQRPSLAES